MYYLVGILYFSILSLSFSSFTCRILSEMMAINASNKWAPVAHVCNPSYSGGRDQENRGSKPAWTNRSRDPILKNPLQKGLVEWLKVQALSSSSTAKKKKKRTHNTVLASGQTVFNY
jgi:hypothetical protein